MTAPTYDLVLVRHGRTAWSHSGQHTGHTDVPLDDVGLQQGAGLARLLSGRTFVAVVSSPLQRARRTADLAGLTVTREDPDLMEWDYGGYEGLTTAEVREMTHPGWTVFGDGVVPGEHSPGETLEQLAARAEAVLERVAADCERGDVALVGHGHQLRVLTAVYLGFEPRLGAHLELEPASVSELNRHHGVPTIQRWNVTAP